MKSSQQLASLLVSPLAVYEWLASQRYSSRPTQSAYFPLLARDGDPYEILRKTIRDVVLVPQGAAAKPLYILGSVAAAV